MGLTKRGLTNEQIIELVQLHAPTVEGLTQSKVLELIAANTPSHIEMGSYKGVGGTFQSGYYNVINYDKPPIAVVVQGGGFNTGGFWWIYGTTHGGGINADKYTEGPPITLQWSDTKLQWGCISDVSQLNVSGIEYKYLLIY